MKKTLALIMTLLMCLSLCSCTELSMGEETTTILTVFEQIQNAETIQELRKFRMVNYPDENQKNAVIEKWKDLFLNTFSGYYYNREPITPFLNSKIKNGEKFKLEDNRALYIKSEDEIYIMPFSEAEMKEKGLSLEDIPNMENSEKYCYKAIGFNDSFSVDLINKYYENTEAIEDFKKLSIWCNLKDGNFKFGGTFADETTETVDGFATAEGGEVTDEEALENTQKEGLEMVPIGTRSYYLDIETALAAKKAYEDEKAAEQQAKQQAESALKNSIPKVGMTAAEVRKTKWGYPDKINKDTYANYVKEQWVYDSYGYVYFTNGVVTSVSER